jgi:hypothetical protein
VSTLRPYKNKEAHNMENTAEKENSKLLIEKFLLEKHKLPYANIGLNNEYLGWVKDFNLRDFNNNTIGLDLTKDNDLFLLFVLAVVWSRTGPWENSAFFVSYLKTNKKDTIEFWNNEVNFFKEESIRKITAKKVTTQITGINPRKTISFRKDVFSSVHLLAKKWPDILKILDKSEKESNYILFMEFMRSIEGLGVNKNKILIKIPLILRELRCQQIYSNISGELCCVPDARVFRSAKELMINIPKVSNLENLIKGSSKIYQLFGDLYDLPLFAYDDLK